MQILFVHERFGAMAGAEINLSLTAAELKKRGHTVGILHGGLPGKDEDHWRTLFDFECLCEKGHAPAVLPAVLSEFDPNVLYVHKTNDLILLQSLLDSGRPLVRMVHDHDLYCLRSYKYFPLSRAICQRPASAYCVFPCGATLVRNRNGGLPFRWASYRGKRMEIKLNQRFQRVVVASDYMKGELLRNGFESSRIEVHPPVPAPSDFPLESSFGPRNLVLYAGQVIRGKGVDLLLRALGQLCVEFECVILGDGSHRPYCEKLCRSLGLKQRVAFKGYVPPHEMPAYYAEASVAVMSSVWPEPFGAAGLEAMRYGLPVVAFDAGAIREWLLHGQTGFLVPHLDFHRLGLRIEQLLTDKPLARKMGFLARTLLAEKFNFETYVTGLEKMLQRVATEGRTLAVA